MKINPNQMKNIILIVSLFISNISFAKICERTILTANKTDMREELNRYKTKGWLVKGNLIFKDYAFRQKIIKKDCSNEER